MGSRSSPSDICRCQGRDEGHAAMRHGTCTIGKGHPTTAPPKLSTRHVSRASVGGVGSAGGGAGRRGCGGPLRPALAARGRSRRWRPRARTASGRPCRRRTAAWPSPPAGPTPALLQAHTPLSAHAAEGVAADVAIARRVPLPVACGALSHAPPAGNPGQDAQAAGTSLVDGVCVCALSAPRAAEADALVSME